MSIQRAIFGLLVCFFSVSTAATASANEEQLPTNPKLIEGKLPNGLRYLILKNGRPEHKVELRLVVNAGSILEDNDQQGLAHFMEHMNFNGLKHFPHNEVVHYLQSIGVGFGADLNAYTGFDETVYILPVPSDNKGKLDSAFTILADWSGNALLDEKEIDAERGVVLEESRLHKGADNRMFQKWLPRVLNGSKYAERFPIGKDSILKTFAYSTIKKFYKDWYRPDLECVIVVGDLEPIEAEKLIKEKFSGFENPKSERPRPELFDIPHQKTSMAIVESDAEASNTMVQIFGSIGKKVEIKNTSDYKNYILKSLFTSMLNQRLAELSKQPNPPFIWASGALESGYFRGWSSSFSLYAGSSSEKVKEMTTALVSEAMKAKKFGFTSAEFERARAEFLSGIEKMYQERDKSESANYVDELIRHFLTGEVVEGVEWEYQYNQAFLPKATLKDVNAFVKMIDIDQLFTAVLTSKPSDQLPSEQTLKGWIEEALKAAVKPYAEKEIPKQLLAHDPVPGTIVSAIKNEKLGTITYTLSNGVLVTTKVTDYKNDEIVFQGVRKGGISTYKGKDYENAKFASAIVEEMGFGAFSNTTLDKFLSGKQVGVGCSISLYSDNVSGSSTKKDLETAFQLIYLKTTAPHLDSDAFAAFITKQKQSSEDLARRPENVFFDSIAVLRTNNNPLARRLQPVGYFDQINAQKCLDFYKERLGSAYGMHYYFVGSFSDATIKPLLLKYIASLPASPIDTSTKDLGLTPLKGMQNFTLHRGQEDKCIVYNQLYGKTTFDASETTKMYILNEIIDNEITDTLRENMGAIYSGYFGTNLELVPQQQYTITTYLPCGAVNVPRVNEVFWRMLEENKKPGAITKDALTKAQKTAIQKYQVNIKTNGYWLGTLSSEVTTGFNPERILTYEQRVNAITLDDLTQLANKYFRSENVFKSALLPEAAK